MHKVEDFVIALYCLIEDELYPHYGHHYGRPRRSGFSPSLSDSECLTIEVVGHFLGYSPQKQLYEQMHDRWVGWFPALRDRVAFVRHSANLWQVKAWMHHHIVQRLGGHQAPTQVIDTVPVPICKVARRFQRRIFRPQSVLDLPESTKGYCAAKDEAYFGFKGGLRITDYGLIVHAPLLQAYGHDSTCRDDLLAGLQTPTQVVGDSAFLDLARQQELQEDHHIRLLTPLKGNMQPTDQRNPFIAPQSGHRRRRRVETLYTQLVQRFHVQTMKVRDAWPLQNQWTTKILAHSIAVLLNIRLKRKTLDFDGLVEF